MSLKDYPKEPFARTCGSSWNRELVVDGLLPNLQYGAQFTETLPPLADRIPPDVGRDRGDEQALLERLSQTIGVYSERVSLSGVLSVDQKQSALYLLDFAARSIEVIRAIYGLWYDRAGGAWGLGEGDLLKDFDPMCTGFGDDLTASQFGESRWCPTQEETADRKRHRKLIRDHLEAALRYTRCAQYVYLRIVLYKRALDAYREEKGFVVGGLGAEEPPDHPGPGYGFGGLTGFDRDGFDPNDFFPGDPDTADPDNLPDTPEYDPPDDPFPLPTPDPEEDLPEPPDGDPVGEPGPSEGATPSETQSTLNKGALALGGIALGVLLWKALK